MIRRREFLAGAMAASTLAATPAAAKTEGFKNPFAAAKKFFTPSVTGPKVPLVIQRQRTNEIWAGEVGKIDGRQTSRSPIRSAQSPIGSVASS